MSKEHPKVIEQAAVIALVTAAESMIGFAQEAIGSPAAKRFDDYYVPRLRAAVAAIEQAGSAAVEPTGWKLVPIEPTLEMLHAGSRAADGFGTPLTRTANAYKAMLDAVGSAAPSPAVEMLTDGQINEMAFQYGLVPEGYWSEDAIAFAREILLRAKDNGEGEI